MANLARPELDRTQARRLVSLTELQRPQVLSPHPPVCHPGVQENHRRAGPDVVEGKRHAAIIARLSLSDAMILDAISA